MRNRPTRLRHDVWYKTSMTSSFASSLLQLLPGVDLGSSDESAGNRFSVEGLDWGPGQDGITTVRIRKLEAASVRLASGALSLDIARLALHGVVAQVRNDGGTPRLAGIEAREAEFSGLKLQGPLRMPARLLQAWEAARAPAPAPSAAGALAHQAAVDATSLAPLEAADGTLRGQITDAHLLFDADVTVPIRNGQIDFNDATVEHIGPDSRMGVSRMGIYVDAPNGRSYIYQFASAPLAGVEFERRGALLSPWVSERGKLRLRAFAESKLRQEIGQSHEGLTEQAKLLLGRTSLSGTLQLGDGLFAVPGLQASLEGRAGGRNAIALHAEAVGRGLTARMPSLALRDASAAWRGVHLRCDTLEACLQLQVVADGSGMRFTLELESGSAATPRIELHRTTPARES